MIYMQQLHLYFTKAPATSNIKQCLIKHRTKWANIRFSAYYRWNYEVTCMHSDIRNLVSWVSLLCLICRWKTKEEEKRDPWKEVGAYVLFLPLFLFLIGCFFPVELALFEEVAKRLNRIAHEAKCWMIVFSLIIAELRRAKPTSGAKWVRFLGKFIHARNLGYDVTYVRTSVRP